VKEAQAALATLKTEAAEADSLAQLRGSVQQEAVDRLRKESGELQQALATANVRLADVKQAEAEAGARRTVHETELEEAEAEAEAESAVAQAKRAELAAVLADLAHEGACLEKLKGQIAEQQVQRRSRACCCFKTGLRAWELFGEREQKECDMLITRHAFQLHQTETRTLE
jgi:chromosome segregation ATPase